MISPLYFCAQIRSFEVSWTRHAKKPMWCIHKNTCDSVSKLMLLEIKTLGSVSIDQCATRLCVPISRAVLDFHKASLASDVCWSLKCYANLSLYKTHNRAHLEIAVGSRKSSNEQRHLYFYPGCFHHYLHLIAIDVTNCPIFRWHWHVFCCRVT